MPETAAAAASYRKGMGINVRKKFAFGLTLVMTVVITALRMGALPALSAFQWGAFTGTHIVIGLMLVTLVADVLLCRNKDDQLKQPADNRPLLGGVVGVFVGAVILLKMLYDAWAWIFMHTVPSPNTQILNTADGVTLIGTLLCGALAGVVLMWQGFLWMSVKPPKTGNAFLWMSLAPSLWMWFRLARYEISYASTVDIVESFFDFMMLISTLLFLFALARFTTQLGKEPRLMLLIAALATVLSGASASAIKLYELMNGVSNVTVTGVVDVATAILALYIAALQVFGKPPKAPVEQEEAEQQPQKQRFADPVVTAPAEGTKPTELTVDDILRSMGKDEK